jgi:chromosome segregation ATPase
MPPDTPDDTGRWLTYAEFASLRGIARESAVRMAQRNHWRRRRNNRGEALVMVPEDALPADTAGGHGGEVPGDNAGGLPGDKEDVPLDIAAGALAALEGAVEALREQLDVANTRAERAETDRAEERQRADDLRERLIAMQEQLADAHAALQAAAEAGARAERAEAGRDQERGRADRAEAATTAERARADALRERIEALQEQLAAHQEGADATEAIRQAEAMVDSLREAHAGEVGALKAERHRLATQIDGFAARADQAEAHTDSLRARVDVLQRERDTARVEAEADAAGLRQAEEEQRATADALRERADELQAGQELMMDMHARSLAAAQEQLERVREAAEGLRQADAARKARGGRLARLRAAWRGE